MRIVFMGTADFGIASLQAVMQEHSIVGIVSTSPRPKGRGLKLFESPIVSFAKKEKCGPIYTPESLSDPGFVRDLQVLEADCFVVVAFRLLPRQVFSIPRHGTLNVHASLLPAYRGPAPIHRTIEAGEKRTGVTVFRIDECIDTGDILKQAETGIGDEETTPELYQRLSRLGSETLCSALRELEAGTSSPFRQSEQTASRAPKLKKREAVIDWTLSASVIFNRIRAFKPFPGTYTLWDGKRLGIEWAVPVSTDNGVAPFGTIVSVSDNSFDVQTGAGVLRVLNVKPEGRNSMMAGDFLRGTAIRKDMRFHE
jgi:methionyl-tRNA formyltransferase